jgi:aminodeoxyfutalosine deaminase
MILRSRFVWSPGQSPIEDGAVRVNLNRIVGIGSFRGIEPGSDETVCDIGECILLPGLINAHCHLDYTEMAGQASPPVAFPDWIKALLALKAHWNYTEYARSWLRGAGMLVSSGVTTVADIEAVPELLPDVWTSTPLRVWSFLEMTGIRSQRSPGEILREATDRIGVLPKGRGSGGLSPHAPYSTTPELLRLVAGADHSLRLTTHVSESREEYQMFTLGTGPLFDWLKSQRDMSDCGAGSPVQHLQRQGLLRENLLAVHVNYLAKGDAQLLATNRVSVVHCPRSHAYFRHDPFPLRELRECGVNICLGTDSLVSVLTERGDTPRLSLFADMQAFASVHPDLPPERIVRMATRNGAAALGQSGVLGELSPGAKADLIAIPYPGGPEGVAEAVLHHQGPVAASMIDGDWALQPNGV